MEFDGVCVIYDLSKLLNPLIFTGCLKGLVGML